jgi:hypothetical protein
MIMVYWYDVGMNAGDGVYRCLDMRRAALGKRQTYNSVERRSIDEYRFNVE